jgi:hypothetical protein
MTLSARDMLSISRHARLRASLSGRSCWIIWLWEVFPPLSTVPLIQGTVGSQAARLSGLPYASWSSRFKQLSDRYLAPNHGLSTRSLRIGGASHAHIIGVSADHIRAVGCWDSEAFNLYIARSRASILGVTQRF